MSNENLRSGFRDKTGKFAKQPEVEVLESIPTRIKYAGKIWVEAGE